jgi:hypothetical protein
MVLSASNDNLDQELARWFGQHGGPWSGTASELLAAVKASTGVRHDSCPQSFRALYSHIESHRQRLRSLGVDALLQNGPPRMISLRSCPDEKPVGESSLGTSTTTHGFDPSINLPPMAYVHKEFADSGQAAPTRGEARTQDVIPANSEKTAEPSSNAVDADRSSFEEGIFKSAGEALFALVEMRMQIREQGLQLESAIDLVVGRTQEITRSCGVAVGLLQQDSVVYPARTGVAATMGALHFQPNLFQFCLKTGRTLQLRDAQNHPRVGAECRREGIGSLILVPLFHNREVAGAIEFLFKERRLFSIGDVMDLELIAGVISESLSGAETKPVENIESQGGDSSGVSLNEKAGLVQVLASPFPDTTDTQTSLTTSATPESIVLGLLSSDLNTAPTVLWPGLRRAWMRWARVMGT